MPLEFMGRAPYAPASAMLAVIGQHRKTPIAKFDATVLDRQVNVSESLIPRTLVALNLLGFSDEDGNATPEFTALARVPEGQLRDAVGDILRTAYEPVLATLGGDPGAATLDEIKNAFRSYNPLGQLERMVQLFTGLMEYVGMMPELPRRRAPRTGKSDPAARRTPTPATVKEERAKHQDAPPPAAINSGDFFSRTVTLAGGAGTITLAVNVNPLALKGKSREFLFTLTDLMDDYEVVRDEGEGVTRA